METNIMDPDDKSKSKRKTAFQSGLS